MIKLTPSWLRYVIDVDYATLKSTGLSALLINFSLISINLDASLIKVNFFFFLFFSF